MKVALVLEGGAMRGIYTAGVLDVLLENNIEPDCIIGVSAGALFGANFVSNQPKRAIRYNEKYIKNKEYMGFYSFLKTGNIMGQDFCFNKLIYELDKFDYKTFDKSKIKFYATVTNLETGAAEYKEIKKFKKDIEYLRASGSIPVFSKTVTIGKNKYLDGGISDSIPVTQAKKMGYDKIIVVTTRPLEYRKKKNTSLIVSLIYRKYPNFIKTYKNRYKKYNETVEEIINLEKNKEIFVIRPTKKIKIKHMEKDILIVKEQYNLGIKDCQNKIKDLKKYLNRR